MTRSLVRSSDKTVTQIAKELGDQQQRQRLAERFQELFEKRVATATLAGPRLVGSKARRCHSDTTFGWRPVAPVPRDSTPNGTAG